MPERHERDASPQFRTLDVKKRRWVSKLHYASVIVHIKGNTTQIMHDTSMESNSLIARLRRNVPSAVERTNKKRKERKTLGSSK